MDRQVNKETVVIIIITDTIRILYHNCMVHSVPYGVISVFLSDILISKSGEIWSHIKS